MLFSVGGLFSTYEGVEKLRHPHELDSGLIAVIILLVAVVLESYSLSTAVRESSKTRGDRSWWQFIRQARAPELPIVLLEDLAAELGLIFALLGVGLTLLLDDPIWDGAGTLAIGILLLVVAVLVATEAYGMLVGEAATLEAVATIRGTLAAAPGVREVIHLRTLHLGPDELLVAAKIGIVPTATMREVAATIDGAEEALRASLAVPMRIFLEPDIPRDALPRPSASGTEATSAPA